MICSTTGSLYVFKAYENNKRKNLIGKYFVECITNSLVPNRTAWKMILLSKWIKRELGKR